MIIIVAKSIIKKDKIEKFKLLAEKLIEESKKEEGCISYKLFNDINNKTIYTFIEQWKNKNAIDIHNNSKHFKSIVPKLQELQEKDSEVNLYEVVI
ncbi:putative quinol monooxygenase [Clostridium botulinum]|uniref:putative quinol monooxygenase n=1 Tax=Clostridium botulinum TaxID=1491 RepID=UPI0005974D53|nr:putative quinol monooxygenase [Clostridium botulinum]KIL09701.1 antibiotic biosynthesis monooxygenase [Clostridium botulinum]MBY6930065.1 antibiotic biosynthesis monooxygenase [Clostridium botulinum]MBY6933414.1 antibiotic biosynthesis monooxygenase [Clostridium botulinum]NFG19258.1 antibiotic biosynthesis monooxygenase [Clostridium botulinum]NFL84068.1 antibiotic biosynthesis monooxygenase [Clostridium botulinum]